MRQTASHHRHDGAHGNSGAFGIHTADVRMVLRAPDVARPPDELTASEPIAPIERGLSVMSAFQCGDEWLGNQAIANRTNLPKATVTRLTHTLTMKGFLNHSTRLRKYRLSPAVLALGFACSHTADVSHIARASIQSFADECGVFAVLATRTGLKSTILDRFHSRSTLMTMAVSQGAQFPLENSPLGLALLSGLPELERDYLLERIRLKYSGKQRVVLRHRVADALTQVEQKGYCVSTRDWGSAIVIAAAPLIIPDRPALVIGYAAHSSAMSQARLTEFVAPRLRAVLDTLRSLETGSSGTGAGNA